MRPKQFLYKAGLFGGAFLLLLLAAVLLRPRASADAIMYSLEELEAKAQGPEQDASLLSYPLLEDERGSLVVYTQPPELYGASSCAAWVVYQTGGRDILLQDASLSRPVSAAFLDDSIYIFGVSTAFATTAGINITKYTLTEDQLSVENAIDGSSLGAAFCVYQDELNEALCSVMPVVEDGMGRMYYGEIEDAASLTAYVADGGGEHAVTLTLSRSGTYILHDS